MVNATLEPAFLVIHVCHVVMVVYSRLNAKENVVRRMYFFTDDCDFVEVVV